MDNRVVLFSILNWGLGHATRSIPIIKELQLAGWKVVVCCDGMPLNFLKQELYNVSFEELPSYNIHYRGNSIQSIIIKQLPKMFFARRNEHRAIQRYVEKYNPSLLISDNRFGCYHSKVTSIFITHQWNLLSSKLTKHALAAKANHYFITKYFDQVWIADDPRYKLSGILSENNPDNLYTGVLSRFPKLEQRDRDIDALYILSGVEPVRTDLEQKLLKISQALPDKKIVLVRGTKTVFKNSAPPNVTVYDLVNTTILHDLISRTNFIVSRSGYSSLLDYLHLGVQNLLLIPTPYQTEQIYLARYFEKTFEHVHYTDEKNLCLEHIERGIQIKADLATPLDNPFLKPLIESISKID